MWLRGATVARLTPDQKAACSNHVGVIKFFVFILPERENICFKYNLTQSSTCHKCYNAKVYLPPMRIELMTFGLQDQRSATEL